VQRDLHGTDAAESAAGLGLDELIVDEETCGQAFVRRIAEMRGMGESLPSGCVHFVPLGAVSSLKSGNSVSEVEGIACDWGILFL
jgi:hypothetical protein